MSTLVQSSELQDPMVEPSAPCLRKTKISAPTMVCMASVERAFGGGGGMLTILNCVGFREFIVNDVSLALSVTFLV